MRERWHSRCVVYSKESGWSCVRECDRPEVERGSVAQWPRCGSSSTSSTARRFRPLHSHENQHPLLLTSIKHSLKCGPSTCLNFRPPASWYVNCRGRRELNTCDNVPCLAGPSILLSFVTRRTPHRPNESEREPRRCCRQHLGEGNTSISSHGLSFTKPHKDIVGACAHPSLGAAL